jgi:hypothetical protein
MKTLLATILLAAPLLADFNYESKTRFTGGSLLPALSEKQPLDKPIVATRMIKGTRMATITKGRTIVVDLGPQTILEMNFAKKTYSLMTFAQMKEILDRAMKSRKDPATAIYKIDSKPSGGTKAFGFFNARELVVSMTLDAAAQATPQSAAHVLVDAWHFTMPGFGEAEDFRAKLAEKLSPAYASGLSAIGILEPELLPAFEEFGKLINPGDDMPVQTTIRIGNPTSGDLGPIPERPAPQKGVVSGTISRIGSLTHKKSAPAEDPEAVYPGLLLELTTELSNFGSGPADEVKFNVPEGFKQSQPPH